MLNLNYKLLNYSQVSDYDSFYKEALPEVLKVKGAIEACKILYSMSNNRIILSVAEGERVYKIDLLTSGANKSIFGTLIYMPLDKRLDLYGYDTNIPLIQWKNKKVVFNNLETLLELAKADKIFSNIINVL